MNKKDIKKSVLESPALKGAIQELPPEEKQKLDEMVEVFVSTFSDMFEKLIKSLSDPANIEELKKHLKKDG